MKDPVNRQVYDLGKINPEFHTDTDNFGGAGGGSSYAKYYSTNPEDLRQKYEERTKKWDPRKKREETIKDEY